MSPVRYLLVAVVLTLSLSAHSLVGTYLKQDELLPQNCILQGTIKQQCSSVVIGSDLVLTAGHCAFRRAAMFCPLTQEVAYQREIFRHKQYQWYETPELIARYDLAIIRTARPFQKTKPFELAPSKKFAFDLLETQGACQIFGFGANAMGVRGTLRGVEAPLHVPPIDVSQNTRTYAENIVLSGKNAIRPGDSGGALVCFYKSVPYLVGISSRSDQRETSHFALVYEEKILEMLK